MSTKNKKITLGASEKSFITAIAVIFLMMVLTYGLMPCIISFSRGRSSAESCVMVSFVITYRNCCGMLQTRLYPSRNAATMLARNHFRSR